MVDWDNVHSKNYEAQAFWDIYWIRSANHLLQSSLLLKPKITELWENYRAHAKDQTQPLMADHYQGPYFMLVAYALENFFKAAIVRQHSKHFKQRFKLDKKFPKELQGHDLIDLSTNATYITLQGEEDLLRRLTRSAIWYGRYPVPLNYKHTSGNEKFKDGKEYSTSWFGEDDLTRIDSLIDNIKQWLNIKN